MNDSVDEAIISKTSVPTEATTYLGALATESALGSSCTEVQSGNWDLARREANHQPHENYLDLFSKGDFLIFFNGHPLPFI